MRNSWPILLLPILSSGLFAGAAASSTSFYKLESATALKGSKPGWDYLAFDPGRSFLFIARRAGGVSVFDVKSRRVVARIARSEGANATALIPEFDRGYTTNGDGSTTVFRLSSLKTLDRIKLGEGADAAFYEPATRQLAFTLGDTKQLALVDAATGAVKHRVPMDSEELEAVAADGRGNLYVVERDKSEVAKVDATRAAVVERWSLANCQLPTGVAIDRADGRLFVGCRGDRPVLTVVDTSSGRIVAQPEIGRGNDGVVFDPETRKVYTSNGIEGNIVIYDQVTPDKYSLSQAITTRPMARTMALDPRTKHVFTVTAEGLVDPAKPVNRRAAPFYPNTYWDNTFTVLEYAPHQLAASKDAEEE